MSLGLFYRKHNAVWEMDGISRACASSRVRFPLARFGASSSQTAYMSRRYWTFAASAPSREMRWMLVVAGHR